MLAIVGDRAKYEDGQQTAEVLSSTDYLAARPLRQADRGQIFRHGRVLVRVIIPQICNPSIQNIYSNGLTDKNDYMGYHRISILFEGPVPTPEMVKDQLEGLTKLPVTVTKEVIEEPHKKAFELTGITFPVTGPMISYVLKSSSIEIPYTIELAFEDKIIRLSPSFGTLSFTNYWIWCIVEALHLLGGKGEEEDYQVPSTSKLSYEEAKDLDGFRI